MPFIALPGRFNAHPAPVFVDLERRVAVLPGHRFTDGIGMQIDPSHSVLVLSGVGQIPIDLAPEDLATLLEVDLPESEARDAKH